MAIAKKAEISDPSESWREDMEEKAPGELVGDERHGFLFVVMTIVPPTEADDAIGDLDQTIIADGDAVGVAGDVAQHVFSGAGKRRFDIDHSVRACPRRKRGSRHLQPGAIGITHYGFTFGSPPHR